MPTNPHRPVCGHRSLRKGRHSAAWQHYHITTVTAGRMPLFADPGAASAACRCFNAPELLRDARMLAWVLMPDHAHWLIQLGEAHTLQSLVHALKTFSARNANLALGRSGPVWARAFHDRALRSDDDLATVAQYILANPQRAGLVRHPDEYPYRNTRL